MEFKYELTVIIPVYNAEETLGETMESVFNQQTEEGLNYEVLLINDGSQDNCHRICDEWAKKDERIKVIHQTIQGHLPMSWLAVK